MSAAAGWWRFFVFGEKKRKERNRERGVRGKEKKKQVEEVFSLVLLSLFSLENRSTACRQGLEQTLFAESIARSRSAKARVRIQEREKRARGGGDDVVKEQGKKVGEKRRGICCLVEGKKRRVLSLLDSRSPLLLKQALDRTSPMIGLCRRCSHTDIERLREKKELSKQEKEKSSTMTHLGSAWRRARASRRP